MKLCLHYNKVAAEGSKCTKFEKGCVPRSNNLLVTRRSVAFYVLVNNCRIYDEDNNARSTHYKSISEKKGKRRFLGKSYVTLADKWKYS